MNSICWQHGHSGCSVAHGTALEVEVSVWPWKTACITRNPRVVISSGSVKLIAIGNSSVEGCVFFSTIEAGVVWPEHERWF